MVRRSVALVFVLCLVAPRAAPRTTPATTEGPAGPAAPPPASPIVIGFPADLTTDWAYYDSPMQEGAQFAVDQINDDGGVLGGRSS